MSHAYIIDKGLWILPDGTEIQAYSGHGQGLNNPNMCDAKGVGPLPTGNYTIGSARVDGHLGPIVMNLEPVPDTNMFGRDLIRLHGDNSAANHTASDGCVVMNRSGRTSVSMSSDRCLEVVATED